jgi:hypothetical protein
LGSGIGPGNGIGLGSGIEPGRGIVSRDILATSPPLPYVAEILGTPMAEVVLTLTPSSSKVGTLASGDGATPAVPSAATLVETWYSLLMWKQ